MDNSSLVRWRSLDANIVLAAIADHAKEDSSFVPSAAMGTTRWHASVFGRDVELLLLGPKFWNTRERVGGGGAIDMVMHLAGVNFKAATRILVEKSL